MDDTIPFPPNPIDDTDRIHALRWLNVILSEKNNTPLDHVVLELREKNNDLNHGYRGPYAWLQAIYIDTYPEEAVEPWIYLGPNKRDDAGHDFATGTGGWYRYVCGAMNGRPVKRLKLYRTGADESPEYIKFVTKYGNVSQDLNSERGDGVNGEGTHLYIIWD